MNYKMIIVIVTDVIYHYGFLQVILVLMILVMFWRQFGRPDQSGTTLASN